MKLEDVLSKDAIITINKDMKFFSDKRLDKIKMGIGMETLWLVSQIENNTNEKEAHTTKGLLRILDLLDSFYKTNILTFKTIIKIKNELLGEEYVKKCCYYAIFRCYANDIDLIKTLQSMYFSKSKKKITSKQKQIPLTLQSRSNGD